VGKDRPQLEQLELELEEEEMTQAELETADNRMSPDKAVKARPERKSLPELRADSPRAAEVRMLQL
jgi:hypothetical protein